MDLFRYVERMTGKIAEAAYFFVFVPPTGPNCDIPSRPTEPDNEITRAGLSGRDNREIGPK